MLVKLLEEVEGLAKVDRTSISAPTLNGHSYNWSPSTPLHIHALHNAMWSPHSMFQVQTDFQAVIFGSRLTTYSSSSIAAKRMSVETSRGGCLCSTLQSARALCTFISEASIAVA